jgi:hypothetical protein
VEEAHTIEVEAAREMNLDIPEEIDLVMRLRRVLRERGSEVSVGDYHG